MHFQHLCYKEELCDASFRMRLSTLQSSKLPMKNLGNPETHHFPAGLLT
jgi:hypothetical protein